MFNIFKREVISDGGLETSFCWSRSRARKSWSRSWALKVSVSLKAICRDHRDLKKSNLKKIIEIAFSKQQNDDQPKGFLVLQSWSTKSSIIYLNTLCRFPALRSCKGSWVTSIVMNRLPVQFYCVLCVLVKIWGLGLDLGFLRSRSRKGWSGSRRAWSRSWSWSRMVRSRSRSRTLRSRLHHWHHPTFNKMDVFIRSSM